MVVEDFLSSLRSKGYSEYVRDCKSICMIDI